MSEQEIELICPGCKEPLKQVVGVREVRYRILIDLEEPFDETEIEWEDHPMNHMDYQEQSSCPKCGYGFYGHTLDAIQDQIAEELEESRDD